MSLPKDSIIPCFLCGKTLNVKLTKNSKPYFICDPCGLQVFIRSKPGIRIIKQLVCSIKENKREFLNMEDSHYEVVTLISNLSELQNSLDQIKENRSLIDFISSDSESAVAEKTIEKQITRINNRLKELKNST